MAREPSNENTISPAVVAAATLPVGNTLPYTVSGVNDDVVFLDSSAGTGTVTMPAAASVGAGRRFTFILVGSGTNAVTLKAPVSPAAGNLDKFNSVGAWATAGTSGYATMASQGAKCVWMSDGVANWHLINT